MKESLEEFKKGVVIRSDLSFISLWLLCEEKISTGLVWKLKGRLGRRVLEKLRWKQLW